LGVLWFRAQKNLELSSVAELSRDRRAEKD